MLPLPGVAEPLLMALAIAYTEPSFKRALVLLVGAILTRGRRTVTRILATMRGAAPGHPTSYHRLLSRASWCLWPLAKVLAGFVVALAENHTDGPWILVAGDDTVAEAKGAKVYGKGCHHDAVRSSHSHTAWRWGHRWVVLAVLVPFPWARRPWALPVLCALYLPPKVSDLEGRRHKTPIDLARGLMAALLHWFPDKKFIFLGDGGYASHSFAKFFHRHRRRAALVARFVGDAALYDPPPKRRGRGRPRVKGRRRRSPCEVVARGGLRLMTVDWYAGQKRRVKLRGGTGHWYKSGGGLVPVRWVFVRDDTGDRRDEYFFTTNPHLNERMIIRCFTCRWSIETTFQEMREHLGFETTRGRCRNTVLRAGPCLLGLYTIICCLYYEHVKAATPRPTSRPCYKNSDATFSDAVVEVRRLFWEETIFVQRPLAKAVEKIPRKLRRTLIDYLAQSA